MKTFLVFTFTVYVAAASASSLDQSFLDAARGELDKTHTNSEVTLGELSLEGGLRVRPINRAHDYEVIGAVRGETFDYDFGDPVDEVRATCRATMVQRSRGWKVQTLACRKR